MNEAGLKTTRQAPVTRVNLRVLLRRLSAVFVLATLVAYSAPPPFLSALAKSPTPLPLVSTATRAGRLAVFDDAWSTINERYYDRAFRGLDWEAQRIAFRNLAAEADSGHELYAVLRRMVGALNDPHTRIFSPEEKFDWWRPRFVSIGLGIKELDGLATVVKVEPNSAPAGAGIRPGDVIDSVDGQPTASAINQRLTSATPTASERARAFATIFEGQAETSLELGWKDKRGQERHARFDRYWQQRELGLSVAQESGKFIVIEIDAFTRSITISFARVVKEKLKGTRGVIIDLRNNGGGDAEAMAEMASSFLGAGVSLGEFIDRSGAGFSVPTSFLTAEPVAIRVPIVVLTSEHTASAAEIFVVALRKANRATIIGTQTCGCVLAIRARHNLPDGGVLDVSELDYKTPAGERLEGNGIQPDQTVVVRREDLYAKRDAALAQALTQLNLLQNQFRR
jgi:carboxyl-terminal processing protease